MGRASIKSNMGDSRVRENCKDHDSEDKIRRAERRWKRREIILNDSLKHNCNASATRATVKSEENKAVLTEKNGHMVEDKVDEDYNFFLDTYVSDVDVVSDNNVDGSDADVDTGHNSDNDIDSDPQYKKFLENLRKEGNSYVYSCFVENQLVHVRYEGEEEEEEERLQNGLKLDTTMLNGLTQRDETGNVGNTGIDLLREQTGGSMESQQNMETERGHCNKKPNEDVSGVPNKSCHSDVEFDNVDEDYQLFLNSWTDDDNLVHMGSELMGKTTRVQCDKAFDTREMQCDMDEEYKLFLESANIVDDDLVYMRDKNISKTNKMEGGSKSSDPDLILLEPDEICENTPFISSKTYDSSWFESEMKPRHSREFSAYAHSQFRKKLMEYLERPYDQQEYVDFMHELHQRRQKERHLETRHRVIDSYHTHGETKSYLELYPDLSEAIAELKEQPHRILFLLRGFIFWLQNLTHDGNFRPWRDESCLEILRKIDNNVDGSDADVDTGHNSDDDIDSDPQYKKFLENLRKEGNSYVYSCFVENQLAHVRYEGEEEEEEERLRNGLKLDTKMLNGLTQRDETGNVGNTGIDLLREQTGGSMESQQNMETERGHCNKKPNEDVSGVPNKSCHSDVEFDNVDEDYQLFLNSWTDDDNLVHMGSELMGKTTRVPCDKAFDTREMQCDMDEEYKLFLNSANIVDDDLVYMRDRNTSKTNKMEGGSKSSDPDLILLEPDEICENTPFISSKTYDSSWFESEMKPRHSREFSAYVHSQFRKKLMEYLERPYDQQEYVDFMHELHQRRQKERHLETRHGVIDSYHTHGETKSYLELYPDLSEAIAELKEQPHRVLFLLRGFIFWLQNLTHDGNFRPWRDESCLEILRKM